MRTRPGFKPSVESLMRCMRYYVFRQQGEWAVRHGGKVCCAFPSEAEAIQAAIETAQDFGDQFDGAEVLVEADNDQFRVIWPRGQDPDPPAGEAKPGSGV